MAQSNDSHTTTNHSTIRDWVCARGGIPSRVRNTGNADASKDPGILRIDFPGYGEDENLEAIPWEAFFSKFDKEKLAFVYQEQTEDGGQSRFCKIIDR